MAAWMRKLGLGLFTCLLSLAIVIGQGGACSELVLQALESVKTSCADLGRNEVCYGYNNVQASFLNEVPEDYFSQVSDISPILDLASIQTLPLNSATGQWGVAVMNIQAKLPETTPGEVITFILLGDVTLENAVAPEDAFVPSEGITISLAVELANLRSGAGLNFNVVDTVQAGEALLADGLSESGQWVRVVKNERPAWLSRALVVETPELGALPVLTDEIMMPMQAFYLRTGFPPVEECVEAPTDALIVQGPQNYQVQLTVNGANVALGSSGVFRTIDVDGEPFLELTVLDGEFEIDGTVVHTGQRTTMCLGNEASRGLDGQDNDLVVSCAPSAPKYVPNFGTDWCNTESLPTELLNYGIEVLCPGETPVPVATEEVMTVDGLAEAVGCNSFAILTGDIPATNFTLEWTAISGADSYEIAVFDSGGYQISSTMTSGSSLDMNGGQSFPPSGYVDVRAFGGGDYLCFARKDFTRSVDPNVIIGAPAVAGSPQVNFSCSYDVGLEHWDIQITWANLTPPVIVGFNGAGTMSPPQDIQYYSTSSGIYTNTVIDIGGPNPISLFVHDGASGNFNYVC